MIYVIGEALIDIIVDAKGTVLASVVGGAPLNTARTIARLEVPATFLGGISTDAFGNRMMRLLAEDGVHYALGTQVSEPTTLAIAELDQHGAATYRFVMDNTSAAAVTPALAGGNNNRGDPLSTLCGCAFTRFSGLCRSVAVSRLPRRDRARCSSVQ